MRFFNKIGEKLVDKEDVVMWNRLSSASDLSRNMVYRIPNEDYPEIKKVKSFGVRDYERCLFYNSGVLQAVLEGGIYEVEKEARNPASEIVWVDTGIIDLIWGVPHFQGLQTSEMIRIGMNGTIKIRISDPSAFITRVVAFKKEFTDTITKDFVISLFITSLRDIVKNYTLHNILRANREDIKALTRTKVSKEFKTYGLELISNDILGYAFPPEIQEEVDIILGETRADLSKLREEKERLESSIRRSKVQLEALEEQYASGTITELEYDTREPRMQKIIQRRYQDLTEIQHQINTITKDKGIKN